MAKYSIVIPVYKSSESLKVIAEQVHELQEEKGYQFELIFVNDSPGFADTENTLSNLSKQYPNIKVITLRKNQGQHVALLIGLKVATGDFIITMDDDLQHPVKEIPKLAAAINNKKNVEAVFAVPSYTKKRHSLWRNTGSYILNKVDVLFLKKPPGLIKSPFRIITSDLAKNIVNHHNAMPALSSLIIDATSNIINIEVEHSKREFGRSNYSLRDLISLTFNNIIQYSSLPLKLMGIIGVLGFLFSIIFILMVIIRKVFIGIDFPGYASTVTLISFFGGLNLLAVGIIGEYLIRIIREQQKRNLDDLIKN